MLRVEKVFSDDDTLLDEVCLFLGGVDDEMCGLDLLGGGL